jgi:uncharacterized membrane protein
VLIFLIAAATVVLYFRRRRPAPAAAPQSLSDAEHERLRRVLDDRGGR